MGEAGRPDGGFRPSPYRGRQVAVGTKHGKQHQFGPAFLEVLRVRLVVPEGLDTDRFGTFSGEIPRAGSPVEAARAKAALAIQASGLPLGLASEASYGPLPGSGCPGHEELLLFADDDLGIEVLEGYRTVSSPGTACLVAGGGEAPPQLTAGLPGQALIVRSAAPPPGTAPLIRKGITDAEVLRGAIAEAAGRSADGMAVVEPDLRAQHNPSRRRVLARLALTLANRLATPCPACRTPGFGRVDSEPGLPCRACHSPTPLARAEIHACCRCEHTLGRPVATPWATPADCPRCNP